jgi:hypothetical protein
MEGRKIFWTIDLKRLLVHKFLGCLLEEEMAPAFDISLYVDLHRVLRRFQEMTGISLQVRLMSFFFFFFFLLVFFFLIILLLFVPSNLTLQKVAVTVLSLGSGCILESDIVQIKERVKNMNIIPQAEASMLSFV